MIHVGFIVLILVFCSSSIWECSRSSLRHPFAHCSNLVFVIDSFAVGDVRFLIEDTQIERRENADEGTGTKRIHRIELNAKLTEDRRRSKTVKMKKRKGWRRKMNETKRTESNPKATEGHGGSKKLEEL
jgi:hypothetical protein